MSGIPAWAVRGARVVLIDAGPGDVDGPHDARVGDICIIDEVGYVVDQPACICREEGGRWTLPEHTWARLSRFRPFVSTKTQEQDVAEFRKLLTQKLPEAV